MSRPAVAATSDHILLVWVSLPWDLSLESTYCPTFSLSLSSLQSACGSLPAKLGTGLNLAGSCTSASHAMIGRLSRSVDPKQIGRKH